MSAATVRVRRARADEHAEVGRLLVTAFTSTFPVTDWYRDNLLRVPQHAQDNDVWLAHVDGRAAAAVLTPLPHVLAATAPAPDGVREFGFRMLGVLPWARGRGVGAALVGHCAGLARDAGLTRIGIRSGPQMTAAHAMYARLGFVRRPERETLVVDGGQRLLVFTYDVPDGTVDTNGDAP